MALIRFWMKPTWWCGARIMSNQVNVPAGLSNVVAIAGAYDHSLALKNNGRPVAWGDNIFGQATVPAGLNNAVGGGRR